MLFRLGFVFALLWGAVLLMQRHANAFDAEFGDNADEAAHYVTGLMVRDYVAQGFPGPPLAFARNYYVHYPKVALGHWPPFFYVVQAAWALIVPPCHISIMLLMAAITALLGTALCQSLNTEVHPELRLGAGVLLISLPIMERFSHIVMAEMLVGLLVFLAVVSYGRYLDTERWQPAACFGICFALALLTKGTAIQLAMVPPLALLLLGRFHLLIRFSFWLPAIIVCVIAGPWYLWVPGAQHESVARFGGVTFATGRLLGTFETWFKMLGPVLSLLVVLGLWVAFGRMRRHGGGKWSAAIALLVGAYVSRLSIGAFGEHHLLVNLAVLMMFAAAGAEWLLLHAPMRFQTLAVVAVVALLVGINVHATEPKRHFGYLQVARNLLARPDFAHSAILVCSSAEGEGMLISEIAMKEARPGHIVLRASKMLASSDWMGWDYRPLFQNSNEMMAWLESVPAGGIVIDDAGRRTPHGKLLYDGLSGSTAWERLPLGAGDILVFRLIGQEKRPVRKIQVPMRSGLFGTFQN